jgi:predicted permease
VTLLHDIRSAARTLRAHPAFALTAALTLAGAVGANSAVFELVNAVLLSPLPFHDASRLVAVEQTRPGGTTEPISLPDYRDLVENNRSFAQLAAAFQWSANLTGGEAERVQGMKASSSLFAMLARAPLLGRVLAADDERGGGQRVVVLTYGLWRRRFGGDAGILGSSIILNGDAHTIVGVLPADFVMPVRDAELVAPFPVDADPRRAARDAGFLRVVGRLRPDVTRDRAREDLDRIFAALRERYPDTNATHAGARVVEWHQTLVARQRATILLLEAAVVLVLAVACANLANLFLAFGVRREHEFAVRAALGASRWRRIRQLTLETAFIAAAGCAGALVLHRLVANTLSVLAPADLLSLARRGTGTPRVVAFTAVVSMLVVFVLALLPALRLGRDGLLKAHRSASGDTSRTRGILVCAEVALASALIILAVLLSRSVANLHAVDPGIRVDHLLTIRLSLPRARYKNTQAISRFAEEVRTALLAIPGVSDAAAVNVIPLNGYRATADVWPGDRPAPPHERVDEAQYRMVSPSYARTFGLPVLAGRGFDERDNAAADRVVLVSRTLALRYWTLGDAPGKVLIVNDAGSARPLRVVGVVGDVKHYGLDAEVTPDVYVPVAQVPDSTSIWLANNMYWGVRTTADPKLASEEVRRVVHGVDRDVPTSAIRTMEEALDAALAPQRLNLWLIEAFAALALALASAGVYAVTAFSVALRRREMAIRAALGASRQQNVRTVLRDAARPLIAGLVIGCGVAAAAAPALRSMLFGVDQFALAPYVIVAGTLLIAGLAAALMAARPVHQIAALEALAAE